MYRGCAIAIASLVAAFCAGCESWRGFGFRADGREMPRLRQVQGHVFSTEIDATRLRRLREAVVAERLDNVTLVEAHGSETGLPPNCCDAIVLRRVYHHLTDPASINAGLLRSLRPGGVLGVPAKIVIGEVGSSGFELLRLIDDWPGRGPFASYCAIFRKP